MSLREEMKNLEKGILVGISLNGHSELTSEETLNELEQLATTAGVKVLGRVTQVRDRIHPAYYLGSGKVEELQALVRSSGAQVVIFDDDLSPAQIRNLEKALDRKIVDRSTLILEIFARHARTREAKTQVELAQLQHLLPRLTRQWAHLSRQVGGIGTRGPGETQLEVDRRLVRRRIETLRRALQQIDRQRAVRRKNRRDIFRVALVGYTNVGKSTIMNQLSGSEVVVRDQLFATLDSTVRRVQLNHDHQILLSDTVGFIRKLPHQLVASFKSTLEEVQEADLLLHVVDASHPHFRHQMQSVMSVLEELNAHRKPILLVFNKIDLLQDLDVLNGLKAQYPDSVFTSAYRNLGFETLKRAIVRLIERDFVLRTIRVPYHLQKLIAYIHASAVVEKEEFLEDSVQFTYRCSAAVQNKIVNRFHLLERTSRDSKQKETVE